jgi:hypothetical protein
MSANDPKQTFDGGTALALLLAAITPGLFGLILIAADATKRELWIGVWCQSAPAQDKVQYELQERCGNLAARTFQKEWGSNSVNTKDGHMTADYENHYSARLNKCFYLEISTSYVERKEGITTIKSLLLYDLNENKRYGEFRELGDLLRLCEVRGTRCNSEAEWRRLARRYLEE